MSKKHSNIDESLKDQILVMDAQDGDAGAMDNLVRRWQKRLWQHVFRLTANQQGSWDITQQSWLSIIKGLRKLHDPAKFKPWAYRITTNKAVDWIRKRKAHKQIYTDKVPDYQHIDKEETGVKELLEKLDIRKRVVLSLYYFEEHTISQISEVLRIPQGTVKSRLHNARRELKKLWQQYCE